MPETMGAPRRKSRLVSRRRTDDDGEDDGSMIAADDSLSEPSVPSDVDDDADGEGSETSEVDTPNKAHTAGDGSDAGFENGSATVAKDSSTDMSNAHIMMNGLTIADGSRDMVEEITIETVHEHSQPTVNLPQANDNTQGGIKSESLMERRRREHEEYKKKRDADPSFVPNRGVFFMHDQRTGEQEAQNPNGTRQTVRGGSGRGRGGGGGGGGRAGFGGQFDVQRPQPEDGPWKHDLHQTVAGPDNGQKAEPVQTAADTVPEHRPKPAPKSNDPLPNRDFSSTTPLGVVNCHVSIPGMKAPIPFSGVPQHLHVRLPHHRPPLRRDKPVRVSLPDTAPSYIFPAEYRSFIFIPRALRPNQQGFGRPRGRGSIGGPSGLRSGRNSIYGGSVYSPSIAMSRRSSFARDRESMASPAMSVMSRTTGPIRGPSGPPASMPPPMYKPGFTTGYAHVPMHQPRPTKNVAVPDVESPGMYAPAGQQPFANQVPMQYGGEFRPDSRRTSYPSQRGTPLSQIPERDIHGHPIPPQYMGPHQQPPMPPQGFHHPPPPPAMYYPQQPYQQQPYPYYYPPQAAPGHQYPGQPAPPPPPPPPAQQQQQQYGYMPPPPPAPPADPNSQPGMVAHESNGTVYYYDQSQMAADAAAAAAAYQGGMMQYGVQQPYMPPPQGAIYYPQQ